MGVRLDITVKKLVDTNSITITTFGSVGTYVIDIISSSVIPSSSQVQETVSFIPSTDILKESVERLSIAISRISKVISVTSSDSVISITFIDAVTDVGFSETDTANNKGVQKQLDNGTITFFSNPFVTNITVTSVTHGLPKFGYPVLKNPIGNMGDLQETTILFTSADAFTICNFFYGWTDNDTVIYPNPSIFKIDTSLFEDIRTGAFQKFTGDTTTFNAVAPLQGNKVVSVVLTNVGGDDYSLVVLHHIPIFPQNLTNEFPPQIDTSLKIVFQIDLLPDLISTDQLQSTTEQDLSKFLNLGNVGYLNEVYRTGQKFYKLNSIVWDNPENQLNAGADTLATLEIEKLNGNFDAVHEGIINYSKVTDVFDEELTQLENLKLNTLDFLFNGSNANDSVFKDVSVSFLGNIATITFTVLATAIQDDYYLWVNLWDGVTDYANQNVRVEFGTVASLADETVVQFATFPSAIRDEYNYSMHYLDNIVESFNEVKSYIDDYVISRFLINNSDIANNKLVSFTIRLKEGDNILESYQINVDDLVTGTHTIERNFNLLASDIRKNILVLNDFAGNYTFIYPFQILDSWVGLDVVQETIAVFNQTNAIGEIQFSNNWISPEFELGNYNLTKNDILEPQIVSPPAQIKYFNEAGTVEVGKVLQNDITLVVATFEEDNLNDFVADPLAPFTYVDNVFTSNYLCAYFGINTNNNAQGNYFRFHNMRDNEQSPFSTVQAGYYAKLERLDIDTATLTAKIDYDLIKQFFGEDFECLKVTARIDKMQDNSIPPVLCIIILQTDADNLTTLTADINTGVNSGYKYKGVTVAIGDVLNQVIGTADGTDQDVEYFTDSCTGITEIIANGQEWKGSIDLTELTAVDTIQFMDTRQDSITFAIGNVLPITLLDLEDSDFISIDLTNVNIGGNLSLAASSEVQPISPLVTLTLPSANNNVYTNFSIINSVLTTLDLSQQNALGGNFRLRNNNSLTNLTLGSSNETFTQINITNNSSLSGTIDFSGYTNVQNFFVDNNILTGVTFAVATTLCVGLDFDNNNLTTVDLTPMGNNFSGELRFESNDITSFIVPVNSQAITRLDLSSNNLSVLDVSNLAGIQTTVQIDDNSFTTQANINFGTITSVVSTFLANGNGLLSGTWDFTTFIGVNLLSGTINMRDCNISSFVFQSSILTVSILDCRNNAVVGLLDLSPLSALAGSVRFDNNNTITGVTLPTSSQTITLLQFATNAIISYSIASLTGSNNNIQIRLENNSMTTVTMDSLILELDNKGWINGILNVSGQLGGQQPTIGAAAYISLLGKGWSITI